MGNLLLIFFFFFFSNDTARHPSGYGGYYLHWFMGSQFRVTNTSFSMKQISEGEAGTENENFPFALTVMFLQYIFVMTYVRHDITDHSF